MSSPTRLPVPLSLELQEAEDIYREFEARWQAGEDLDPGAWVRRAPASTREWLSCVIADFVALVPHVPETLVVTPRVRELARLFAAAGRRARAADPDAPASD